MITIDLVFCAVVLFFFFSGIVRGIIKELFGKVSVIAGLVVAIIFTPLLESYLDNIVKSVLISKILSFLLIFMIVFLIVKIIQHLLQKCFSGQILKGLDRTLGAFFGLFEGLVVCYFILLLLQIMPFWKNIKEFFEPSLFYKFFGSVIGYDYFLSSVNQNLQNI